ncbi:N-acetylmannosamine-6-phosphate 2-epimerase [Spirulina sp. CS-785/01]|uniref:N-acetylmannosamine-6-phosphate 2-epimerase n=1 Tax=Spirulina sp. CS-785/01 TaxID=3021716 RepID=UPI00233033A1|nr:N-acetylmannosamine-6-phosphate 2-epimerase [Spirulina sp. CS-785/01]MDB9313678.1 N-acetylmannosamine-6-phosphate 2-epimerase [Spirulina sp. CS-785/01]
MLETLNQKLIVSCQAPPDSPLYEPDIIAAMAKTAIQRGAAAVRIDTPAHVHAVRQLLPQTPIIGLWKQKTPNSQVYITPRFSDAVAIAEAGANIIAIDATQRPRPDGETVPDIIEHIHHTLNKPVMADIDTLENAQFAIDAGADVVGTTLFGYTQETATQTPPGWDILRELAANSPIPVICEGGIATPDMAKQALDLGAYAVVVGTAITGIDLKVMEFQKVF